MAGTHLPLVVISHGRTGSFLGHRDTAQALADAGFVVAAISHPGDSAQDSSRSNTLSAFVQRPADIRRLIDYLLGSWPSSAAIDPGRIGFFGFSRGGYTGLVAVGAVPVFASGLRMCYGQTDSTCEALRRGTLPPPSRDDRIRAAVIADPLGVFFGDGSFRDVRVPIQLWRSEFGGDGVTPGDVAAIAAALPGKPDLHTVALAGHFAFLPPCPEAIRQVAGELCTDAAGFDREAFHKEWNAQVVEFFRRNLP
jgi:predicted dienelactone hydrolase